MALSKKKRAASPTPSMTTVGISVIITDLTANLIKIFILEVAKPEPFYKSR
jgi:hypothetical protein